MATPIPRSPSKEVREVFAYLDTNGFTYTGLDSSGHHHFEHPAGHRYKIASTPSASHGLVQRHRNLIDKLVGNKRRGKFDRDKQRARLERDRLTEARRTDAYADLVATAGRNRADALVKERIQCTIDHRLGELTSLHYLMTSTLTKGGQRPRF